MIQVAGSERRPQKNRGLVRYADARDFLYAQIDATNLFAKRTNQATHTLLEEWTRELVYVRPDALVVYDRVVPKPDGASYSWRFHFPTQPTLDGARYSAKNDGGGASLVLLSDGAPQIAPDTDVEEGDRAFRVEVGPNAKGRYLAVVAVANGAAPGLSATAIHGAGIEGAAWNDQVVVFSASPRGAPAALPFTYTFQGAQPRTHTLVDMDGAVDVAITHDGGSTTVKVSAGSRYKAENGAIHFQG